MQIDKTTYQKNKRTREYQGYQQRGNLALPNGILVHTTNGNVGTKLSSEANYIANSIEIGAHYLIGKQGEIIEFLDPRKYIAYHAGCVSDYSTEDNIHTIGIEIHNTPKEGNVTKLAWSSLDWLVKSLRSQFQIPLQNIKTHREVAVFCGTNKKGRKIDPSGITDSEFNAWVNSLDGLITYEVINPANVYIRQSPQVNDHNIAGILRYGDRFQCDVLKLDEQGQSINGNNQWAHIYRGVSNGVSVDNLGFVHTVNLKRIYD